MTVKEMIIKLLDRNPNSEVILAEQREQYGFEVEDVIRWTNDKTFIVFTDWRKSDEAESIRG